MSVLGPRKIAYINLDTGTVTAEAVPASWRDLYLGGRGINAYLLYHHCVPDCDPLSAENPLIIGSGYLSGIKGPATARVSITGKSPESGLLGDSNIGGTFCRGMRHTTYEYLVIKGKSDQWVYLLIEGDRVAILPADRLQGCDPFETERYLKQVYGIQTEVLSIGVAGENLVRFATIRSGLNATAGRTGMGCLMGSKKIKAIAVKGGQGPERSDERLKTYLRQLNWRIKQSGVCNILRKYGTLYLYDILNYRHHAIRTYNGQQSCFTDNDALSAQSFSRYWTKSRSCFSCVVGCRHEYAITVDDAVIRCEGPHFGVLGAFGPICAVDDPETILRLNYYLSRLGLDAASSGNIIGAVINLYKDKVITCDHIGDLAPEWGDESFITKLIFQIAKREGVGDLLADGFNAIVAEWGEVCRPYFYTVKGLPQTDAVDVRRFKGFALGICTASRGADHLRSRPTFEALGLSSSDFNRATENMLDDLQIDTCKGKASLVYWTENLYALIDALGICRFVSRYNNTELIGFQEICTLMEHYTGRHYSKRDLFLIGLRIINQERVFLTHQGVTRDDDALPIRYFKKIKTGRGRDQRLDQQEMAEMLDHYYMLHGWDLETGWPRKETLEGLGLHHCVLPKDCASAR